MEHCRFEFWNLVGFESWWCDLGLPKDGSSGEKYFIIRHIILGSTYTWRYFVVENHKFCFCYTTNSILLFGFHFNRTWNFVVILIEFSVKQRSIDICSDFHIHIVVWIFYNIKNVMKWFVILSLSFSHCILKCRFWLYEIIMSLMF
jgi:hypothetical protein